MAKALQKFQLDSTELDRYRMVEVSVEKGGKFAIEKEKEIKMLSRMHSVKVNNFSF